MAEVQIDKMRIRHEQILNWLILNPDKTQNECAAFFNVTPAWLSVVVNSDCFQQRFAEIRNSMDERTTTVAIGKMRDVVDKGLERLGGLVEVSNDPGFVLETTDKLLNRLGFGAKGVAQLNVNVQNNALMVSREVLQQARGEISAQGLPTPQVFEALTRVSADGHTPRLASVDQSEYAPPPVHSPAAPRVLEAPAPAPTGKSRGLYVPPLGSPRL